MAWDEMNEWLIKRAPSNIKEADPHKLTLCTCVTLGCRAAMIAGAYACPTVRSSRGLLFTSSRRRGQEVYRCNIVHPLQEEVVVFGAHCRIGP